MEYYDDDLTAADSLVSLEVADTILANTLHGRVWTARAESDRRACLDDPERQPERNDDKSALRDASAMLAAQPWKGRPTTCDQPQAFPRVGVSLDTGASVHGVPAAIQTATAFLAAYLIERADQPISPELLISYTIGQSQGVFRAPSLDAFPRHVRQLIQPYLNAGSGWAQVRA